LVIDLGYDVEPQIPHVFVISFQNEFIVVGEFAQRHVKLLYIILEVQAKQTKLERIILFKLHPQVFPVHLNAVDIQVQAILDAFVVEYVELPQLIHSVGVVIE